MIYFTADPHFDHVKVLQMCARPFTDIAAMNEEIIHQYNKLVQRNDILIIAGDFAWRNAASWRMKIKARNVWLIWGNHDRAEYARNFSWTGDTRIIKLGQKPDRIKCFISHYAHCFWPASHYGSIHLYGHHHFQREAYLDSIWPERRSMDCGIDAAFARFGSFRPFCETEIIEIMKDRKGHDPVEFYKQIQTSLQASLLIKK